MIYMNSKMIDSFNEVYSHKSLSTELSCILDSGFIEINKCIFFSFLCYLLSDLYLNLKIFNLSL